jgi:hypothetical protein
MKTNSERTHDAQEDLILNRIEVSTKEIHSHLLDLLDYDSKGFNGIPFRTILETVYANHNNRNFDSQLLTLLDDNEKNTIIVRRLAKLINTQFSTYRDIANNMRHESDSLKQRLSIASKPNFRLPEINKNKMEDAMTDLYGQYGESILADENRGHSRTPFVELVNVPVINSLDSLNVGGLLSIKTFLDNLGLADFNALASYVLKYKSISTDNPTIKEAVVFFVISINAGLFGLGKYEEDIRILSSKKIVQAINFYESNQENIVSELSQTGGLAGNGYITLTGKKLEGLDSINFIDTIYGAFLSNTRGPLTETDITGKADSFINSFNAHISNVELQTSQQYNLRLMDAVEGTVENVLKGLTRTAISELNINIDVENPKALILSSVRAINNLLERDKKDSDRVIEAIYLNILYKNTGFSNFYGKISDITEEDKSSKVSIALYHLICELLVTSIGE